MDSPPPSDPPLLVEVASELRANAPIVWRRVSTAAGVNDELWPVHMTFPADLASLDEAPIGRDLFSSIISILGVLPIDRHRFGLESVEPGRGFHEVSSSLWMARWVHIRTVESLPLRCAVRDHVEFTPRLAFLGPLLLPLYRFLFHRRHVRLRRRFGGFPLMDPKPVVQG